MYTRKGALCLLLTALLLFAAVGNVLAADDGALVVASLRFEQPTRQGERINRLDDAGFAPILENERLRVLYRPENYGIRVQNLESGYIWGGLASDKPGNMNKKWSAMGNSLLSVTYFTKDGTEKTSALTPASHKLTYELHGDEALFHAVLTDLDISFDFSLTLLPRGFSLRLHSRTIREEGKFLLGQVQFIPFFGAVQESDGIDGYVLLPDGCGALMRFGANTSYFSGYEKRVFGKDAGVDALCQMNDLGSYRPNDYAVAEAEAALPVLGMVHGEGCDAWFARVVSGAEYAVVYATHGGVQTDYTNAAFRFIYRQKYSQPISRSGAGVQVVQKAMNPVEPAVSYYLLSDDDANYGGMARLYRELLDQEGVLARRVSQDGGISMRLDFLTADVQKGMLANTTKIITTLDDVNACLDALRTRNVLINLIGWQRGGLSGAQKSDVSLDSVLGDAKRFAAAIEGLERRGVQVGLYVDPVRATALQLNERREAAITLSQTSASYVRENLNVWLNKTYFIKPALVAERLSRLEEARAAVELPVFWALNGVSTMLYADQLKGAEVDRQEARAMLWTAMETLADGVSLYGANEYMLPFAVRLYDTPLSSSQYLFETDSVPFLQMTLSGRVELYAPYMNEGLFTTLDLLRHIDYGVYPSLLLSGLDNDALAYTTVGEYASTQWRNWTQQANEAYEMINGVLGRVRGLQMLKRSVPRRGVAVTYYEGGLAVAVNYTQAEVVLPEGSVPPCSALVWEVSE